MAKREDTFMEAFTRPIIGGENPITAMMLGLCSSMAITTSLENGIAMGISVTFVMWISNLTISVLRKHIPSDVRNPVYIAVVATAVTVVDLVMAAYFPEVHVKMGIFLALIVSNCIPLARLESYASRHEVMPAMADGLGMGVGYTFVLCLLGSTREILGGSALGGTPVVELAGQLSPALKGGLISLSNATDYQPSVLFLLPPGAYLLVGLLQAGIRVYWKKKLAKEVR